MMKCVIDGQFVEMTEEMLAEMETNKPIVKVTDKDRISALESAITDLAMMITGVSSNE